MFLNGMKVCAMYASKTTRQCDKKKKNKKETYTMRNVLTNAMVQVEVEELGLQLMSAVEPIKKCSSA